MFFFVLSDSFFEYISDYLMPLYIYIYIYRERERDRERERIMLKNDFGCRTTNLFINVCQRFSLLAFFNLYSKVFNFFFFLCCTRKEIENYFDVYKFAILILGACCSKGS